MFVFPASSYYNLLSHDVHGAAARDFRGGVLKEHHEGHLGSSINLVLNDV